MTSPLTLSKSIFKCIRLELCADGDGHSHRCRNRHRLQDGVGRTMRLLEAGPKGVCSTRVHYIGKLYSDDLKVDDELEASYEPTFYCDCTSLLCLRNLHWCIHKASNCRKRISVTSK